MARMYVDCREMPNDVGCTLRISGSKDEVLKTALVHAVQVHHEEDTPELREGLRDAMKAEVAGGAEFAQSEPTPMPATPY